MKSLLETVQKVARHRWFSTCFTLALLLAGIWMQFASYFKSHFDLISGDSGDNRFNAFLLENSFQQLSTAGSLFHLRWFYPYPNSIALSDTLLGISPLYWIIRALGAPLFQAFEWTLIFLCVFNFFTFRWIATRVFSLKENPVIVGFASFLFAFNLSKTSHIFHSQLLEQMYPMIALYAFYRWIQTSGQLKWILLTAFAMALQFYTAYYFFWFTLVTMIFLSLFVVSKIPFASLWSRKGIYLVLFFVLWMTPLLLHYLAAYSEIGPRGYEVVKPMLPRLRTWTLVPPWHRLNRWIHFYQNPETLPAIVEHWVSPGFFTMLFGMLVVAVRRKKLQPITQVLFGVLMIWFVLTTYFPSYDFSLWKYTGWFIPGAKAVRALSRIGIYLSMFWAIFYLEGWFWIREEKNQKLRVGLILFALICLKEQSAENPSYISFSKEQMRVQRLEALTPSTCKSVFYVFKGNDPELSLAPIYNTLDGIHAALALRIESIQGYSGGEPKGYSLLPNLDEWFKTQNQARTSSDCLVEVPTATAKDF